MEAGGYSGGCCAQNDQYHGQAAGIISPSLHLQLHCQNVFLKIFCKENFGNMFQLQLVFNLIVHRHCRRKLHLAAKLGATSDGPGRRNGQRRLSSSIPVCRYFTFYIASHNSQAHISQLISGLIPAHCMKTAFVILMDQGVQLASAARLVCMTFTHRHALYDQLAGLLNSGLCPVAGQHKSSRTAFKGDYGC